jgi:galactokinase
MTTLDNRTQDLYDEFIARLETPPSVMAVAPGRVNLIGEHTDYNDGFVLPVALERDVRVLFNPRQDRRVRLYAVEFDAWAEFDLDELAFTEDQFWSNYVRGVAWSLQERGIPLVGIEGLVSGNVPRGSGLSSSAALEVACAKALLAAANQLDALAGPQLAKAAQRAENEFVGVNCGIMDQFISTLGAEGHALLIDCRSLEYELVPFPQGASLVIGNTKASRSLASSAYNERRAQCEEGVRLLQQVLPNIQALRDLSTEQLEAHKDLLPPVIYQRCRHVVSENERVMATVEALARNDLHEVGRLMAASHASLRDDYVVSSDALDAMVTAMASVEGCYGARLTGAGFGGCAVALVAKGHEGEARDAIFDQYSKAMNIWPEVYVSTPSAGAQVVGLSELGN